MLSSVLGKKRFYGWVALAGAGAVIFTMAGLSYSYGVFLPRMVEDFGWSRTMVAAPASFAGEVGALLGPIIGLSVVRFGSRKNIIWGNLVAVLGLVLLYFTNQPWHLFVYWGVLAHTGLAFGLFIPCSTVANNWFTRRRSLALGILTASGAFGGFLFPPVVAWVISTVGWRWAWVFLAAMVLMLAVVVGGLLVIRNKPEDLGQVPEKAVAPLPAEAMGSASGESEVHQTGVDWKVRDALRTPAFWLIAMIWGALIFALQIMMIHQTAYLEDIGFSPLVAAAALGLLPLMSILGRFVVGVLALRVELRRLVTVCFVMLLAAVLILINAKALPLIYLYAVLFGAGYGGVVVSVPTFIGAYYGRGSFPMILGWVTAFGAALGALGPILAGRIRDATGSYTLAFSIALAILAVGLICSLFARSPKPRSSPSAS